MDRKPPERHTKEPPGPIVCQARPPRRLNAASWVSLRGLELLLVPARVRALHAGRSPAPETLQPWRLRKLNHYPGTQAVLGKGPSRLRKPDGTEASGGTVPEGSRGHSRDQWQDPARAAVRASANKKLAGLRRYHAARPARTRLKLLEALDRMESGHTVVVGSEFKWSKTTLALEAGVNVNTVVRKLPGGQWVFPEINQRFDQLKGKRGRSTTGSDPREEKIAELRGEVERLKDQNRLLALEVNRVGDQILQERERADRMAIYEQQNASLREEIRRIQGNGEIPLKVARKA